MEVKLLTDKSRLPEIYLLRVTSYEHSPYAKYVNQKSHPNGYFDDLDELAHTLHWIVEHDQKIVGAVRAVIIDDIKLMKENITSLKFPQDLPFAYCGRTAVHPEYRQTDAMRKLDKTIIQFLQESSLVKFGFCYVIPERVNAVKRLGLTSIGSCNYDWGAGQESMLEAFIWRR